MILTLPSRMSRISERSWSFSANTGNDAGSLDAYVALDSGREIGKNVPCRMPRKRNVKSNRLTRRETRELDVKIRFMEGIVRRDPCYVDALQILGDHYTQRGNFDFG